MKPILILIYSMGVTTPEPSVPNTVQVISQLIGIIGGLLGVVALVSLPWTLRKLKAETKLIETNTEGSASDIAMRHMQAALHEAVEARKRIKEEADAEIQSLKAQVAVLSATLEEERQKSERERDLHERRMVQILYDLHAKDLEISRLKQGH